MKIVLSDKIKKNILFTLTKVLPSVVIVYIIGTFIKNDYQLMSIETVLRMPSIIEFIFLFVFGCIGLFCVAAVLLFMGLCMVMFLAIAMEIYLFIWHTYQI